MSSTVTLEEAQAHLGQLIDQLQSGEEVVITRNQQPVARIVSEAKAQKKVRLPGTLKGTVLGMAEDFNAPLDDFKDYMP